MMYRIFTKMVGSRRYQVMSCMESRCFQFPAYKFTSNYGFADELAVLSPRPYRKGVIINPTKVIKALIASKH